MFTVISISDACSLGGMLRHTNSFSSVSQSKTVMLKNVKNGICCNRGVAVTVRVRGMSLPKSRRIYLSESLSLSDDTSGTSQLVGKISGLFFFLLQG